MKLQMRALFDAFYEREGLNAKRCVRYDSHVDISWFSFARTDRASAFTSIA